MLHPEELENLPHYVEYERELHSMQRQVLHMAAYRLVTHEKFRDRNRHLSNAECDGLLRWPAMWPQASPTFSPYPRDRAGYQNVGKLNNPKFLCLDRSLIILHSEYCGKSVLRQSGYVCCFQRQHITIPVKGKEHDRVYPYGLHSRKDILNVMAKHMDSNSHN